MILAAGRQRNRPRPARSACGRIGETGAVPSYPFERRLGAFPLPDGRAELRVWAPRPGDGLRLRVGGREHALEDAGYGIREATVEAAAGDDYVYVVDGAELPDPCSRCQPEGLRGP